MTPKADQLKVAKINFDDANELMDLAKHANNEQALNEATKLLYQAKKDLNSINLLDED